MASRKIDKITSKINQDVDQFQEYDNNKVDEQFISKSLKNYFQNRLYEKSIFKNKVSEIHRKHAFDNIRNKPDEFYNLSINQFFTQTTQKFSEMKSVIDKDNKVCKQRAAKCLTAIHSKRKMII